MAGDSAHLETEVKFYLPDADRIRSRLMNLEAKTSPRRFETNLRFDNRNNDMANQDQLIRLRRDSACRLTFKRRPEHNDGQCKVYHELEVEVSDHDTMAGILNALGYEAVQSYEKWRQTFVWQHVELCIDNMPFGDFLEIEGDADNIRLAADQLNLPWHERILTNYLAIFQRLRRVHGLPFHNVTFDNFRDYTIDMTPHLPDLRPPPPDGDPATVSGKA